MLTHEALTPLIARTRDELRRARHAVVLARDAVARCRTERNRAAVEDALERLEAAQAAADAMGVDWAVA